MSDPKFNVKQERRLWALEKALENVAMYNKSLSSPYIPTSIQLYSMANDLLQYVEKGTTRNNEPRQSKQPR